LLKLEKRATEVAQVLTERANMNAILREKDVALDHLRKQVDSLKAELAASELARLDLVRRLQEEQRESQTRERKEKSKLQKEVETLQRQLEENEVVKREQLLQAQNETERIMRDCRISQEEKRLMTQKLTEI
jgi:hypothetical protein